MYYEIIYETGAHSLAYYEDDEEAKTAIGLHHDKATRGAAGGPVGVPAERIVKVLKYKEHPATLNEHQGVTKDELQARVADMQGETFWLPETLGQLQELSSPMVMSGPHESNFKMEEEGELQWQ